MAFLRIKIFWFVFLGIATLYSVFVTDLVVLCRVFPWIKGSILGIWGIFFLFLLKSYLVKGRYGAKVLLVISFTAILFATMIPGNLKAKIYLEVLDHLRFIDIMSGHNGILILGQVGHFSFFALFGLTLTLLMPGVSPFYILINIVMVAGGTELAQFHINGRTPMLANFSSDLFGGIMGSGLVLLVLLGSKVYRRCNPHNV